MSESNYCVYKHTSPSGKSYVGQTKNLISREYKHKSINSNCHAFSNAIKKYGWDNFTHEILKDNLTLNEANYWEKFYINSHVTLSPHGYNLTTGGDNRKVSEESRKKMSIFQSNQSDETKRKRVESLKIANQSEETKRKRREAAKNISDETRLKISVSSMGRRPSEYSKNLMRIAALNMTEEHKLKIKESKKNISIETRKKLSESAKKRNPPLMTEERKLKISISLKETLLKNKQKRINENDHQDSIPFETY